MSKYNAKKTVVNGIIFDSKAEGEYYSFLVKQKELGCVSSFSLQPKFTLQEGFKKEGKVIRPIFYIADFDVYYPDGKIEIVDIKGMTTPVFDLKKKLFYKKYPFVALKLLKYVKKYGGFIEIDEWKRLKKEEKKK
jgi:hypothetical protein